jgi:hypothetical protein
MLEPSVMRPRENQVRQSELVHPVQALHLRAREEIDENAFEPHAPVHTVVDYLEIWHRYEMTGAIFIPDCLMKN